MYPLETFCAIVQSLRDAVRLTPNATKSLSQAPAKAGQFGALAGQIANGFVTELPDLIILAPGPHRNKLKAIPKRELLNSGLGQGRSIGAEVPLVEFVLKRRRVGVESNRV